MKKKSKGVSLLMAAALVTTGAVLLTPDAHDDYDYDGLFDVGTKVAVGLDGSIYVAGTGTDDAGTDHTDFILVKYDFALSRQWVAKYNGPIDGNDVLTGLAIDHATGNVYISGTSPGDGTGDDVAVKGFEPDGTDLWTGGGFHEGAKRYNSSGSQPDRANDLAIDPNGNLAVCGQTTPSGQYPQGLIVVFEPDGDIKSGWPQTYGQSEVTEEFVSVSCSGSGKIVAAGSTLPSEVNSDKDMLVALYNGGGSGLSDFVYDYQGKHDYAVDVAFTKGDKFAVGVQATTSGESPRMAVYHFDEEAEGYDWLRVFDGNSTISAIAPSGSLLLATGSKGANVLTVNLVESTGAYSTSWGSNGDGAGIRVYYGSYSFGKGNALIPAGTGVFVAGEADNPNDTTPQYKHYLTLGYDKTGGLVMDEFYPEDDPTQDDAGYAIGVLGVGYVYVTGEHYVTRTSPLTSDDDATTLFYLAGGGETDATSSTIETGSSGGGSYTDLASSNDGYQIVTADIEAPNPKIVLRVQSALGGVPTAMALVIETKASVTGVSQKVQVFDYDQGEYVTLDERAATTTDRKLVLSIPGDPDVYMDGSYNVKIRILFDDVGVSGEDPWTASVDHASWLSL